MKIVEIIILGVAFSLSTFVAYLSGRFWRGVLVPLGCWIVYLFVESLHASGWKFEGLAMPLAFAIGLTISVGIPILIITFLGAFVGSAFANRVKDKKNGDNTR